MRTRRRLGLALLLTLLPWPAVWLGMYRLRQPRLDVRPVPRRLPSACRRLGTPPVAARRSLADAAAVAGPGSSSRPSSCRWRRSSGPGSARSLISPHDLLSVVTARGFRARWLLPLGFYFVPVNAISGRTVLARRDPERTARHGRGRLDGRRGLGGLHLCRLALSGPAPAAAPRLGRGERAADRRGRHLPRLAVPATRSIVVPILWHGLVFDLALIVIFAAVLAHEITYVDRHLSLAVFLRAAGRALRRRCVCWRERSGAPLGRRGAGLDCC